MRHQKTIALAPFCGGNIIVICLVGLWPTVCLSETIETYQVYTAWEDWARLRLGVKAGLASSYDRTGENEDYSHYESPTGLITTETEATVKTVEGPGVIYRFWMPHVMAGRAFVVRMYFDGELTPRIDTDSAAIMGGAFAYFASPLVGTCAGGQVCYEPIPFARSLRIETVNKELNTWYNRHYYQYSYLTFPAGRTIDSYTGQLTAQEQQLRSAVVSMFDNAGEHPAGESSTAQVISTAESSIPGGGCLSFDLPGPGLVRKINLRMQEANDVEFDGLFLRAHYDDDAVAAIDVSVADFFGAGKQRALYSSIPLGTQSADPNEGFYCYWPMPFRQSVQLALCNITAEPIQVDMFRVEYEPTAVDNDLCYLHARTNTSIKQAGQTYYTILSTAGCGHYVGDLLYVTQDVNSFWMLEGDDVITVDGQTELNGTGLEDAYNGGAYYNWVVVQPDEPEGPYPQSATRPLNGILYVHREDGLARADQYRWRIADCVPFSQSIEVNVENRYAVTGSEWTSVAFWYEYRCVDADFDNDCDVDFSDFAVFASYWRHSDCQAPDWCGGADFDNSQAVDFQDLSAFIDDWP